MKKSVLILGTLLSMVICPFGVSFADSETNMQQHYISKIQAQGVKFTPYGFIQVVIDNNAVLTQDFILAGMDPKTTTWGKLPPAYAAIYSGSDKALNVLLSNGIDANAEIAGETPLIIAIGKKRAKVVDVLISHGADVNKVSDGKKPLNFALRKKQKQIARSLLKAGAKADDDALVRAIKMKDSALKEAVLLHYVK
jgi:ankyrin repeat protein